MINIIPEKVFKDTQGVSYSRLSKLAESPQAYRMYLEEEKRETSALGIGSAVDLMLTQPDKFDEEIYVMTADKPKSEMMQIFCEVYAETDDQELARESSGYSINVDRIITKFDKEGGREYYDALLKAKGKKVLDSEDLFKANQLVNQIKTNPFTKKYFITEDSTELIFQANLVWSIGYCSYVTKNKEYKQAKGVVDVIMIDHDKRTIQPIELKTGAEGFFKSYWRYKRYLQGAMYMEAIYNSISKEENKYKNYDIKLTKFIYADTNLIYSPVIYNMTAEDVMFAKYGRLLSDINGQTHLYKYKVKGYTQLVAELEWHEKNDLWEYSYDVYMNNGEIDIDAFSIKL